jgi:thiol-disulfide isomerase/thioredoxin
MDEERLLHPAPEELVDWIEDRLAPVERSRIDAHLAGDCPTCQQELPQLQELLELLHGEVWLVPPQRVRQAVIAMYDRERGRQPDQAPTFSVADWLRALLAPRPRLAFALSLVLIVLVGVFILTLPGQRAPGPAGLVAGSLQIRRAGSEEWLAVDGQNDIARGDTIRTGAGASTVLVFPDNSMAQLEASTELHVKELARASDGALQLILFQARGQSRHQVETVTSPQGLYVVETPSATVSVLGTQFIVAVGPQGETEVRVGHGLVAVTAQDESVLLEAGQSVSVALGQRPGQVAAFAPASLPTIAPLATVAPRATAAASMAGGEEAGAATLLATPTLRATPTALLSIIVQPPQVDQPPVEGEGGEEDGRPTYPPGLEDKTPPPGMTYFPTSEPDGGGGGNRGNGG